jgi:hypothetical protein
VPPAIHSLLRQLKKKTAYVKLFLEIFLYMILNSEMGYMARAPKKSILICISKIAFFIWEGKAPAEPRLYKDFTSFITA